MEIKTIQIAWFGPYHFDGPKGALSSNNGGNLPDLGDGKGLYQIYGRHPTYGRKALLYVGQTVASFYSRLKSHQDQWLYLLPERCEILLGRILRTRDNTEPQAKQIDEAERMLIGFYLPSHNTTGKNDINGVKNRMIINYGNCGDLERIVATTYYEAEGWQHEDPREIFFKR